MEQMADLRIERTDFMQTLGVLWYAERLASKGITRPAEQLMVITHFIAEIMGRNGTFPRKDRAHAERWADARLSEVLTNWKIPSADTEWLTLVIRSLSAVAWNPHRSLAELMLFQYGDEAVRRTSRTLHRKGFRTSQDALSTLTDEFYRRELLDAIYSFNPLRGIGHEAHWLSIVFFRFALKRLISDRNARAHLSALADLDAGPTPEEAINEAHSQEIDALPDALSQLGLLPGNVIRLYFGFTGKEFSIEGIAKAWETSEYKIRQLLVLALAQLSVQLKHHDLLNKAETEYLRMIFVEGRNPRNAALKVGRNGLYIQKGLHAKFADVLRRSRTSHRISRLRETEDEVGLELESRMSREPKTRSPSRKERLSSLARNSIRSAEREPQAMPPDLDRIANSLRALVTEPEIVHMDGGKTSLVVLSDTPYRLTTVREVLRNSPELSRSVFERLPRFAWLLVSDPDAARNSERADIAPDAALLQEQLDWLANRSWLLAEQLYEQARGSGGQEILKEPKDLIVEKLLSTLTGISQAIEGELPETAREKKEAIWIVFMERDIVWSRWESTPADRKFDLSSLILAEAATAGDIDPEDSQAVADALTQGLLAGSLSLPGFVRTGTPTPVESRFRWLPPTLEEELAPDVDR